MGFGSFLKDHLWGDYSEESPRMKKYREVNPRRDVNEDESSSGLSSIFTPVTPFFDFMGKKDQEWKADQARLEASQRIKSLDGIYNQFGPKGLGAPPMFKGSFDSILKSQNIQDQVADMINNANAPVKRAIKERKRELKDERVALTSLDKDYQRTVGRLRKEQAKAGKDYAAGAKGREADSLSTIEGIAAKLSGLSTGLSPENEARMNAATHSEMDRTRRESQRVEENAQQSGNDTNDLLREMAGSMALQGQIDVNSAGEKASGDIRELRGVMSDNAGKSSELALQLADSAWGRLMQKHEADANAWSSRAGLRGANLEQALQYWGTRDSIRNPGVDSEYVGKLIGQAPPAYIKKKTATGEKLVPNPAYSVWEQAVVDAQSTSNPFSPKSPYSGLSYLS